MPPYGGRHIGDTSLAEEVEGGVAAGGEISRRVVGAHLAGIFPPGHVAHVVQPMLDLPMPAPEAL
ncbi:MAG TPA: hypothetical protein VMV29_06085 [Ktedonobacterales bacterium]|nr:hypothetical protein [Ktedonobacterales bacterium]